LFLITPWESSNCRYPRCNQKQRKV
jgi:hypothetical protein